MSSKTGWHDGADSLACATAGRQVPPRPILQPPGKG